MITTHSMSYFGCNRFSANFC